MEIIYKVGETCAACKLLGSQNRLRLFHINLEEQIIKCESNECLFPYNDESSTEDEDDMKIELQNIEIQSNEQVTTSSEGSSKTVEEEIQPLFNSVAKSGVIPKAYISRYRNVMQSERPKLPRGRPKKKEVQLQSTSSIKRNKKQRSVESDADKTTLSDVLRVVKRTKKSNAIDKTSKR